MFYGAGSGSGKSTLSRAVYQKLFSHGMSATHVPEEAMLISQEFRPYMNAVQKGEGWDTDTLWKSCVAFLETCRSSSSVHVTDSILPCSDWLLTAGVQPEKVSSFTEKLADAMNDLPSMFVLVECDARVALDRAIVDRGDDWARSLAINRCGSDDLDELLGYFAALQEVGKQVWSSWPHRKIKVNTTEDALQSCVDEIACSLDISLSNSK